MSVAKTKREIPDFETWYRYNINFFAVKCDNDKDKMRKEAEEAYNKVKSFTSEPKIERKKK